MRFEPRNGGAGAVNRRVKNPWLLVLRSIDLESRKSVLLKLVIHLSQTALKRN